MTKPMHTSIAADGYIKCRLPGETPWARIVAVHPDGSVSAELANRLMPERTADELREIFGATIPVLHAYKRGDVELFRQRDDGFWYPVARTPA